MVAGLTYYQILEYFLIYSFIGWCVEVIYQAVAKGLVVNRGFLNGPVCPIYGFGVLAVFGTVNEATVKAGETAGSPNLLLVFVCGVLLTTSIELFGGWALDKIFHARWWDYSNKPFNFHGYICLEFSIIWGLGVVFIVEVVQPAISRIASDLVPEQVGWPLMGVLYLLYAADFALSVMIMVGLNKRMAELDEMRRKMRVVSNKLSTDLGNGAIETKQHVEEARVQAALAKAEAVDSINAVKEEAKEGIIAAKEEAIESLSAAKAGAAERKENIANARGAHIAALKEQYESKSKALSDKIANSRYLGTGRLLRAFPQMEHRDYQEILEELKKMLVFVLICASLSALTVVQAQAAEEQSPGGDENAVEAIEEGPDPSSPLMVTAIDFGDEGWGDGAMIESGGECMLMDTFMPDCDEALKEFLLENGYTEFAIYLSHYHADHFGNVRHLLRDDRFKITTVYMCNDDHLTPTDNDYASLLGWFKDMDLAIRDLAKEKNVPVVDLDTGDVFYVGDAKVEILLGPAYESDDHNRTYLNNNSLMARITGGGIRYLTCGDYEKTMERQVLQTDIDLSADLFKMCHHGGDTSGSPEFLKAVNPSFAYFNSTDDSPSRYASGWASEPVSEMMKIANVHSVRYNGTVRYTCKDGVITVRAERNVKPVVMTYKADGEVGICMQFQQFNDQQNPIDTEKMKLAAEETIWHHGCIPAVYR